MIEKRRCKYDSVASVCLCVCVKINTLLALGDSPDVFDTETLNLVLFSNFKLHYSWRTGVTIVWTIK